MVGLKNIKYECVLNDLFERFLSTKKFYKCIQCLFLLKIFLPDVDYF